MILTNRYIKFYIIAIFLSSCGGGSGGGDSSADGRWSGIWASEMPLRENTCPFVPQTIGAPNIEISPTYNVNQIGSEITILTSDGGSIRGQTTDNGNSFLVQTNLASNPKVCSDPSVAIAIQFFNLDGDTAGTAYTLTFQCSGINQCLIGYVGSAQRL